ncbi:hypothetical protein [Halothiobacillus neapolitanus]|nr:hypothetical protein [Halothiobacillus neapolitanus]
MSVDGYGAALQNIQNRDLIFMDSETGEIFVKDWFRIHKFKGVGKAIALRQIDKIESESIRCLVLEAISNRPQCGLGGGNQQLSSPTPPTTTNSPASEARNTNTPEHLAQGTKPPPSAGECIELFKKNEKWSELIGRVNKSSQKHFLGQLSQLTLRGGVAVSDKHVDAIMIYLLGGAHSVIGATQGILDRGGWDPVRLADAARPGESAAEAKIRLAGVGAQEHDPASDAVPQPPMRENHEHDLNIITSAIKNNMKKFPRNPELVEPEFVLLKKLSPEDPLIQQFENHKKAAAGTAA